MGSGVSAPVPVPEKVLPPPAPPSLAERKRSRSGWDGEISKEERQEKVVGENLGDAIPPSPATEPRPELAFLPTPAIEHWLDEVFSAGPACDPYTSIPEEPEFEEDAWFWRAVAEEGAEAPDRPEKNMMNGR